jgi:pimeloyl-ACP methyl ester carboxylesterase
MQSNGTFESGTLSLPSYLARPSGRTDALPGVIMCHSFPFGPFDARHSASTFPELMDRIANELGFAAMCFTFRGCGDSPGDFSLQGWVDDLRAAIDHMIAEAQPTGLWLVGSNTGGSLAMCVAADDPRVRGCALLGPRADFDDWAAQPRKFLDHCREVGSVRTPRFPADFDEWTRELRRFRPVPAAQRFAPRPLLLLHGDDDESVPASDSRQLAESHGSAEMRVIDGAGHRLRHDPRAMAVLFGWLDRQRLGDE